MKKVVIEKKPVRKGGKTREFPSTLLAYILADMIWEGGTGDERKPRPIWAVFGGTEAELKPFIANLKSGSKAELRKGGYSRSTTRFQFLKSAPYEYETQRAGNNVFVTVYLRPLFAVEPAMIDPAMCQLISAPPIQWQQQNIPSDKKQQQQILKYARVLGATGEGESIIGFDSAENGRLSQDDILAAVPLATHFAMHLDKRTTRPLINTYRFYLQIYLAGLTSGLLSIPNESAWSRQWPAWHFGYHRWASDFNVYGLTEMGMAMPVIMNTPQKDVDVFLTQQVQIYKEYAR